MHDAASYRTQWTIRKYADDAAFQDDAPFEISTIEGNLLLTEGITELWNLFIGGSATAFNNAGAFIGVGDSTATEAAGQTGLQASTNKLYKGMAATYPQVSGASVAFRAVFTGAEANFAWNEWTVANGNTDAAKNLNRKVSAQGTKAAGQTWTIDCTITLS